MLKPNITVDIAPMNTTAVDSSEKEVFQTVIEGTEYSDPLSFMPNHTGSEINIGINYNNKHRYDMYKNRFHIMKADMQMFWPDESRERLMPAYSVPIPRSVANVSKQGIQISNEEDNDYKDTESDELLEGDQLFNTICYPLFYENLKYRPFARYFYNYKYTLNYRPIFITIKRLFNKEESALMFMFIAFVKSSLKTSIQTDKVYRARGFLMIQGREAYRDMMNVARKYDPEYFRNVNLIRNPEILDKFNTFTLQMAIIYFKDKMSQCTRYFQVLFLWFYKEGTLDERLLEIYKGDYRMLCRLVGKKFEY